MLGTGNSFLMRVMQSVRVGRQVLPENPPYFIREELVPAGRFVEVWFLTSGCRWDRAGSCTMCNYGRGPAISEAAMIDAVRRGLAEVRWPAEELVVSPSGSMLDDREVPPGARAAILSLLAELPVKKLLFETRSETVTEQVMDELKRALGGCPVTIEIGIESADPWVSRYCINKIAGDHRRAIQVVRNHGFGSCVNVLLGAPFLSPAEAVADCVATVEWAYKAGADSVVVFPVHAKPFTLAGLMASEGRFRPPSLWALVETLRRLAPEQQRQTAIAWYKNYIPELPPVALPTTCPACEGVVLTLLDRYRATQSAEVLESLANFDCACRHRWLEEMAAPEAIPLPSRVAAACDWLAGHLNLIGWWGPNRDGYLAEMAASFYAGRIDACPCS